MSITIAGALQAARAFKEATQGDVVSSDEIVARTSVCRTCPKKTSISGLKQNLANRLAALANKNRVDRFIRGKACGVCQCPLMLLIPAKEPHTDTDEEMASRPSSCWILKS